jgi:hypothetical protein
MLEPRFQQRDRRLDGRLLVALTASLTVHAVAVFLAAVRDPFTERREVMTTRDWCQPRRW